MAPNASRYERLRAIASGGMATVYLGRAVGPGGFERLVAIKVMHPHIAQYADFVSMFLDEARLAAGIHHPNVVAVHDVGVDDSGVFLVMDYVEGASLDKVLKALGVGVRLPIGIALRIAVDMLAGLHAAHILASPDGTALNLVHRDVSPQNILVGVDGITRITDFGIARAESRLAEHTDTGKVKGKYAYMSIEQIHGRPYDLRSDIYSVGIVLWELLAGTRLYPGDNDGAVAYAAAAGPVQSPRDVNDKVPPELDDIVMRALCRSPEDRFPSAVAFTDAIEDWSTAAGVPISKPRELADFLLRMDDDGPTRIKPQSAADLIAMVEARGPPPGFRLPEDSTTDEHQTSLIRPNPDAISTYPDGALADTNRGLVGAPGTPDRTVEISYLPQAHVTVEMQTEPMRSADLPEIDSLVIPPKPEQPITSGTLLTFTETPPAPSRRALGRAALAAGMMALVVFAAFKVLFPDEAPVAPTTTPQAAQQPSSAPVSPTHVTTATPSPRPTHAEPPPATATAEATAKPAPTPPKVPTATVTAQPQPLPQPATATPQTAAPVKTAKPKSPPSSPTAFRPNDL